MEDNVRNQELCILLESLICLKSEIMKKQKRLSKMQ